MKRFAILLSVVVLAFFGARCRVAESAEVSGRKPNFLFVLVDDWGWSDVAYNGSTFYQTPNIDRLASQGMVFTDGYAAAPLCSATRAGIMSGQYPGRVHITGAFTYGRRPEPGPDARPVPNPPVRRPATGPPWQKVTAGGQVGYLPLEVRTLAEVLKSAGYACGHVGKWHLGERPYYPEHQGFDLNFGGYREGWTRSHFYPYHIPNITQGVKGEYLADRLTDEAIKFIEAHRDGPFYLQLWHYAVHTPIQAKEEFIAHYKKKVDPHAPQHNPVYAGMIESADQSVGRLMEALDRLNLADNTIVVVTGDNGGLLTLPNSDERITSNAPLRGGKAMLWEGGIRVPWVVRWPGVIAAGSTCHEPITSVDLYPTFAELAGAKLEPDQPVDGESLVPLWKGTGHLEREAIYWHFPHYIPVFRGYHVTPASAVRRGDFKLIKSFDTGLELYNLKDDLGETTNLAETMPGKAAELEKMLDTWLAEVGASLPQPNPNYDPAARRPGELDAFDPAGATLLDEWTFDRDSGGWKPNGQCRLAVRDGLLAVTASGGDPFITTKIHAKGGYLVVAIRYRAAASGSGQVLWGIAQAPRFERARRVGYRVKHDGAWHTAAMRIRANGPLVQLRIDPASGKGKVEIDWVRVYREP